MGIYIHTPNATNASAYSYCFPDSHGVYIVDNLICRLRSSEIKTVSLCGLRTMDIFVV